MTKHRSFTALIVTLFLAVMPVHRALALQSATDAEAKEAERVSVAISGHVVDDATGKPVANFSIQGGHVDEKNPAKITWGYSLESRGSNPEGGFDSRLDWAAGWRSRIIAGGYTPEPTLLKLPKPGAREVSAIVIRLKRGRQITGQVFDYNGKPVANAGVYVVGNPVINLTGGRAMELAGGFVEDHKPVRFAADADGAFTVTGIGVDDQRIAVTSAALDLWVVPVPAESAGKFEIRLPQPGTLLVHYDIPGAPENAKTFLQLHTWEMPEWKGVSLQRYDPIRQHVDFAITNLPPGDYTLDRIKKTGVTNSWNQVFVDRRNIKIESGKTTVSEFVRLKGAPISGQVIGLDEGKVAKAKPTRVDVRVQPPKSDDPWDVSPFDVVAMEPGDQPLDGKFTTERILPGRYKIRAEVFIPETEQQRFSTGIIPPAFEGEVLVTVPEQGLPEPVKIPLAPFKFPAR